MKPSQGILHDDGGIEILFELAEDGGYCGRFKFVIDLVVVVFLLGSVCQKELRLNDLTVLHCRLAGFVQAATPEPSNRV